MSLLSSWATCSLSTRDARPGTATRGDERVDTGSVADAVADVVVGRRRAAGDRAAGAEDDDGRGGRFAFFVETG